MTRRPSVRQSRAVKSPRGPQIAEKPGETEPSRSDLLVRTIDHLSAAQREADAIGETFLSYLIAMAIQEARTVIRSRTLLDAE